MKQVYRKIQPSCNGVATNLVNMKQWQLYFRFTSILLVVAQAAQPEKSHAHQKTEMCALYSINLRLFFISSIIRSEDIIGLTCVLCHHFVQTSSSAIYMRSTHFRLLIRQVAPYFLLFPLVILLPAFHCIILQLDGTQVYLISNFWCIYRPHTISILFWRHFFFFIHKKGIGSFH